MMLCALFAIYLGFEYAFKIHVPLSRSEWPGRAPSRKYLLFVFSAFDRIVFKFMQSYDFTSWTAL